jgi:hypothetical protein
MREGTIPILVGDPFEPCAQPDRAKRLLDGVRALVAEDAREEVAERSLVAGEQRFFENRCLLVLDPLPAADAVSLSEA